MRFKWEDVVYDEWVPVPEKGFYLYAIGFFNPKDSQFGAIKIGKATNPKRRVKTLQVGSDNLLTYYGLWDCVDSSTLHSVELACHKHFRKYKKIGEWFNISCEHLRDFLFMNVRQPKKEGQWLSEPLDEFFYGPGRGTYIDEKKLHLRIRYDGCYTYTDMNRFDGMNLAELIQNGGATRIAEVLPTSFADGTRWRRS